MSEIRPFGGMFVLIIIGTVAGYIIRIHNRVIDDYLGKQLQS